MSQYVQSMLPSMGLATDATGNIVPAPKPGADAPAAAPDSAPAPAQATAAAPAQAVAPVKATQPGAAIPEPPVVGQASPDDAAAAKKKTLLGG
jgi:hypothetical protein